MAGLLGLTLTENGTIHVTRSRVAPRIGGASISAKDADIFGNLEIEEWQVDEAADKTLKQLIWYEDAIKKLKSP